MADTTLQQKRGLLVRVLAGVSLLLLIAIFYSPVWWVSLTAPNYPAEAFPDGVRIHFHANGVFNGCTLQKKAEIEEDEVLDCVHEMDAINHFVGMFPIASGGVVEKMFSPFLFGLLSVMVIGFVIFDPALRMKVMAALFALIAVFMYLTYFGTGGIAWQNTGYLDALVTSLGQGKEEQGEEISPIIAKLKESLLSSGVGATTKVENLQETLRSGGLTSLSEAISKLGGSDSAGSQIKSLKQILAEAEASQKTGKALDIDILKSAFEADQARKPASERQAWTGSGQQVMTWHYEKSLGRWFNNPRINLPMVATMKLAGTVLFWVIVAGMAFLVFAGRDNGLLHWLLILVPVALPLFFVIEYASWLWWYGHTLNEMGAFTLKPFMPTVFGQGKVAQFATHSYPHRGFLMMVLMAALLALAALIRRKQLMEEEA
jgi:hypothetical protein